jgi:ABC-2 type transport system ATP-binding protein
MPVIEVRNLYQRYGDREVVRDLSLSVEPGEIFGILGPNGAGKTTTVECVAGLRRPTAGTVRVLGLDPGQDRREVVERVGVQLQESQQPDRMRVGEALRLYASFYRHPRDPGELLARLDLAGQERTPFGKLSGGQKQRLSVALALVGSPEVALLDELTTGLDPQGRRDVWDLVHEVRAAGTTIVIVTHLAEEAERLCDRIAVIHKGQLRTIDTPAALLAAHAATTTDHRPTLDDAVIALTRETS